MTLKECYEVIGGNYDDILSRFRREELVKKFVLKFLDDNSYDNLCRAIEENNGEEAFRAAHTIKGICQNLAFDKLFVSASALTEALRDKPIGSESIELLDKFKQDHALTMEAIENFKKSD